MATKYSTQVTNSVGPRQVHAGLQTVFGLYNAGGETLSVSDTIQMVRIPNGAIIVDWAISGIVPGVTAQLVKIGDGGDDDRFGSVSLSATSQHLRPQASTGHAFQYSISDDANPLYDTIDLTLGAQGSATVTCSIVLTVTYYMGNRT